jgi:hypothetical protein
MSSTKRKGSKMNKILMLGAVALVMQAVPALAEEGGPAPKKGGRMMEKIFTEQDANGDGKVSKEEFLAHAGKKFDAMDGDKDGGVTKEEIKAHYEAKKAEWKAKKEAMDKAPPAQQPAPAQ